MPSILLPLLLAGGRGARRSERRGHHHSARSPCADSAGRSSSCARLHVRPFPALRVSFRFVAHVSPGSRGYRKGVASSERRGSKLRRSRDAPRESARRASWSERPGATRRCASRRSCSSVSVEARELGEKRRGLCTRQRLDVVLLEPLLTHRGELSSRPAAPLLRRLDRRELSAREPVFVAHG
jgi:hypothetical protein